MTRPIGAPNYNSAARRIEEQFAPPLLDGQRSWLDGNVLWLTVKIIPSASAP